MKEHINELKHRRLIGVMLNHEDNIGKMISFDDCVFEGVTAQFRFLVDENTDLQLRYFPLHFYACVFYATTLDIRVILPPKVDMPEVEVIFRDCLFDKKNFRIVSNLDIDSFDINERDDNTKISTELEHGCVKYTEVVKISRAKSVFNLNNFIKI